jgi:surface carbohydrate biosynthesis protein (TIGR04326 family)
MSLKIFLQDDSNKISNDYDVVINWSSFESSTNIYSIPQTIEDNSDEYKRKYLDWIYSFPRQKINGKSIKNHLLVRDDFSLWWMTLLFEKSKWKSKNLYQVFQLLALESILNKHVDIQSIDIQITEENSTNAIKEWCISKNIDYKQITIKNKTSNKPYSINKIFNSLPNILKATIWFFRYLIYKCSIKNHYDSNGLDNNDVCIISYLFNIEKESIDNNILQTRYWTKLHPLLAKNKKVNWISLFVKSKDFPNINGANAFIDRLNENQLSFDKHYLLEQNVSFNLIVKILRDYFKMIQISLRIRSVKNMFYMPGSKMNFWNLMYDDWRGSLYGITAISNCTFLNLFENLFKNMPEQKLGLYLMENQPWERAMIYSWKKNNHGQIIGVPHTAVSFWDLRHYFSKNEYERLDSLIFPDKVALNGDSAVKAYNDFDFPNDKIEKVEALRYLYLANTNTNKNKELIIKTNNLNKLLVLCDIDLESTYKQLKLLINAINTIKFRVEITIKPHPLCSINKNDFPDLDFEVTNMPLGEIMPSYHTVFTSNPTAAVLDAYLLNKNVLIMHDCSTFNMSPLRGYKDVKFIKSSDDLVKSLTHFMKKNSYNSNNLDYFYLDNNLPKWRKLLNAI